MLWLPCTCTQCTVPSAFNLKLTVLIMRLQTSD